MFRVFRILLGIALFHRVPGWWERPVGVETARDDPGFYEDPLQYARAWYNKTSQDGFLSLDPRSWTFSGWDGWVWTAFDTVVSAMGWLIFGKSWVQVKTGFALLIRLGALLVICVITHYLFALCWPVVSLIVGLFVTLVWLVRTVVKCFGRLAYFAQRITGGVPEAAEAAFFGPDTGEVPETSDLRKLKKGGDGERWLLIRRDGLTAVFRVLETSSIKSSGLYVTHDPDSLCGDEGLLKAVRGHDRFHLCRHATCQEEGQHFRQYAVVKPFHAEKFQLATATQGAQQAGAQLFGWMSKGATKAVQKARDLASESETETLQCDASAIRWGR